jgi:hypothetical protein
MKFLKCLVLVALFVTVLSTHNCSVRFIFKKVCHRMKIDSTCQPPYKTQDCVRTKTTFEDAKCPYYSCVRINCVTFEHGQL